MGARRSAYNWFGLIGMLALLIGCLFVALPAALSGNILFATDVITEQPVQAVIYYEGETIILEPGDADYNVIVEAAYETLGNETGIVEGVGWSEERFTQARSEGNAVELLYAEPVKIPGQRVDIADPTRLFFPLEVFGHDGDYVFRGGREEYWGLPIRVDTFDRLRAAVDDVMQE